MKVFFHVAERGDGLSDLLHQVSIPDLIAIEGPGQVWRSSAGMLRICGWLYPVDSLTPLDSDWHVAEMTAENTASLMDSLKSSGWLCSSALPRLYTQWRAGRIDPAALAFISVS
jgi:hypothetical protein